MCEYFIDDIMIVRVKFMQINQPLAKWMVGIFKAILVFLCASGDVLEQVPPIS